MDSMCEFIPNHISNEIRNYHYFFDFIKFRNIRIIVYLPDEYIPSELKKQLVTVKKVFQSTIKKFENVDNINFKIIIKYYPTNFKKVLPKPIEFMSPMNVNSGYTSFIDSHNSEIVVFRFEEAPKVICHEMLHALRYHCITNSSFKKISLKNYNVTLEDNQKLDEAIVETWATYLTYRYNRKCNLKKQINFSIFQTAKLLYFYNFANLEEFLNPNLNNIPRTGKTQQNNFKMIPNNPAIFSYYILKSAFLYKLLFFQKMFPLSDVNKNCLKYGKEYIYPFLYNKEWISEVNKVMKSYKFSKYNQYKATLCMTLTEDNLKKENDF